MSDYYSKCAFPKPGTAKKKKLYNGYKEKAERVCAYCGAYGAERHEVFGASNRQTSIEYGLQVDVCAAHHAELHANSTKWAIAENKRLRRVHQLKWMRKTMIQENIKGKEALDAWMLLIGRNYVEEFEP